MTNQQRGQTAGLFGAVLVFSALFSWFLTDRFGDPWVLVQTMLGHANLETTRDCYLEPVSGLQVELFLNDDASEDSSINDLISRVAKVSPTIIDVEDL